MHKKASNELDNMVSFILRKERESKGLTQKQVADKAGINIRQYQTFEYRYRSLLTASFVTAMAVLSALEIEAEDIIKTVMATACLEQFLNRGEGDTYGKHERSTRPGSDRRDNAG